MSLQVLMVATVMLLSVVSLAMVLAAPLCVGHQACRPAVEKDVKPAELEDVRKVNRERQVRLAAKLSGLSVDLANKVDVFA